MDKTEIKRLLETQHRELMTFLSAQSDEQLHQQKDGKWSALQNLHHLLKSLKTINSAVHKPTFLLRYSFGKPNREARTYEGLVQRYKERLGETKAVAPKPYRAAATEELNPERLFKAYDAELKKFLRFIGLVKDRKLDRCLLPHPLLGKLLMREVLYFAHYHTDHHIEAIKVSVAPNNK